MIKHDKPCRCKCGYTCGGRETCEAPFSVCRDEHYKTDCDHDWTGPSIDVNIWGSHGTSATCSKCDSVESFHTVQVGL